MQTSINMARLLRLGPALSIGVPMPRGLRLRCFAARGTVFVPDDRGAFVLREARCLERGRDAKLAQARLDSDLRRQCSVHRTLARNLEQSLPLLLAERSGDRDAAFYAVEQTVLGLAVGAVLGVDARVA
jgi:hypothetical protein